MLQGSSDRPTLGQRGPLPLPQLKKKKTSIKKLRFALIYIFVSLSLKYLDIDLQENIYINKIYAPLTTKTK